MEMITLHDAPATVHNLPPSAKLVYLVLTEIEPATQKDLREHTTMPERTVRYATKKLVDQGVVETEPKVSDPRQRLYTLQNQDVSRE